MRSVAVEAKSQAYRVLIGRGLLKEAGAQIAPLVQGRRAFVVTDTNVAPLYLSLLSGSLRSAGMEVFDLVLPAGESTKGHESLLLLYAAFSEAEISKADVVCALGGGVIGDLTGFAAATWLRGVPYVQLPTSLLAQIDSSVGGKTAVNLPQGKNLVGAFKQPSLVLADTAALETLPPRVLADGMSESIKHGVIADRALFELMEGSAPLDFDEVVERNLSIKASVVAQDETETGLREILNFGHTIGHGVEAAGGYGLFTHGEAVAVGMLYACRLGALLGVSPSGLEGEIAGALKRRSLPVSAPYDADTLMRYVVNDKKRRSDAISLILPLRIGEVVRKKVEINTIRALLPKIL